ncbi:MAG: fused MFS/spermidine synthase, partial [Kiritimatiellae bacterium]|nr:fused MFS/spermidine synthase [Kiritimatiellia bacterium]
MSQKPSSHVFFVHLLFFLSGFSALIYELLWLRQLGLIFGNSVYATATVLAAYMAGLGFGAWWFGRRVETVRSPVRLFGWLVFGTGLYALLVPLLFRLLSITHVLAYRGISDSALVLIPLRFVLAAVIMIIPTALMGGTLPALVRGVPRTRRDFGSSLSLLYGLNTLGAVAGLLASGFFFIPAWGLRGTNLFAVACNVAVGLAAFGLAAKLPPPEETPLEAAADGSPAAAFPPARISLLATALSGFLALALEVVWFRTLVLVFGSTTYSFCAMLSVFLLGLAAGSLVFSRLIDRTRRPMLLFC